MREMRSTETHASLIERYSCLSRDPKIVFNTVMVTLHQKQNLDTPHPNGKSFVLQGGSGVRNTYTLSFLQSMAISRGFPTDVTVTTRISAALYGGVCTLHSFSLLEWIIRKMMTPRHVVRSMFPTHGKHIFFELFYFPNSTKSL